MIFMIFTFWAWIKPVMWKNVKKVVKFHQNCHFFTLGALSQAKRIKIMKKSHMIFLWSMQSDNLAKNGTPRVTENKNKRIAECENLGFWPKIPINFAKKCIYRCQLWWVISLKWIKIFWSVVEIWPVKVCPYTHCLARLIGNFGQKPRFSHSEILLFLFYVTLGVPLFAKLSDFIDYTNVACDFSWFPLFGPGQGP